MQHKPNVDLPEPDSDSAEHSARVSEFIRDRIRLAGGQISFAEYMHHALYAPGLGYYSAGTAKFGDAGDFVTAPEVSSIFGRILARQCAAVLSETGGSSVLEFGAGSGKLAVDLLRALRELDHLPEKYQIFEISPDLAGRQRSLLGRELPELLNRVEWLAQLPARHTGVIVANEVLDALPVERFVRRADGVAQLCVAADEGELIHREVPAPAMLADAVAVIEEELGSPFPEGYVSDVCVATAQWIAELASVLQLGTAFLFDYGVSRREYYAVDRSGGWLRCHYRHHVHNDALILPGIQDITAWVDFSAVAGAAVEHGFDIAGFVTQAQFLIGGGLDAELAGVAELPINAQLELSKQVKLLTLPGEMGESFKCLGLTRGAVTTPDAFTLSDRTTSL